MERYGTGTDDGRRAALSMVVGLLRPDAGSARIFGVDVWADPVAAKRLIGVLPDGMALSELAIWWAETIRRTPRSPSRAGCSGCGGTGCRGPSGA